jgi:DNA-binding GntR family transcriptional regulator
MVEIAPSAATVRSRASRRLNARGQVPLYIQLTEILKERIEAGEWQPHERFATEGQLGTEFGVSRTVIRQALTILENDGQLVKLKGRGVFVAPAKVSCRIDGLIRSLARADPRRVRNRIIDVTQEDTDDRLAQALDLPDRQDTVAHVMSVVEADGQPIGVRDSYLAPHVTRVVLDHLTQWPGGGAALALPGLTSLLRAETDVETSSASPFECEHLSIPAGAPTILCTYREFGDVPAGNVVPVEFARMAYRADITSFRFYVS